MMRDLIQLPIQQMDSDPQFETQFQAETFLEINDYKCANGIWYRDDDMATTVATNHCVKVKFYSTH